MKRLIRRSTIALAISACTGGVVYAAYQPDSFGSYTTAVEETRLFKENGTLLRCDLFFSSPDSQQLVAPKGSIVGQSVPAFVWQYSGLLPVSDYRKTLAIHSHYTDVKERQWQEVQLAFYKGLRAEGAREHEAKIAYAGAYAFAPRWTNVELIDMVDPTLDSHSKLYEVRYNEPAAKGVTIDDYRALVRELMDEPERVTLQDIRGVVDASDATRVGQPIVTGTVSEAAGPVLAQAKPAEMKKMSADEMSKEIEGMVVDLSELKNLKPTSENVSLEIFSAETPTKSSDPAMEESPDKTKEVEEKTKELEEKVEEMSSTGGSWMILEDGSYVLKDVKKEVK